MFLEVSRRQGTSIYFDFFVKTSCLGMRTRMECCRQHSEKASEAQGLALKASQQAHKGYEENYTKLGKRPGF